MGQSKPTQYNQISTISPEQKKLQEQWLQQSGQYSQQAAQAYQGFLPGGTGNNAAIEAANKNFQQKTIPQILTAYGVGSKGSSALNQALAAGASNLNTDLGAIMAQNQLQAAQGLGNLSTTQGQAGLNRESVALEQADQPWWKRATLGAVKGAAAGSTLGPWGAAGGAVLGGVSGGFFG